MPLVAQCPLATDLVTEAWALPLIPRPSSPGSAAPQPVSFLGPW